MRHPIAFRPRVPTYLRDRHVQVVGNNVLVNGRVVDPDATTIIRMLDSKANPWIGEFSRTLVMDVTSHCNMSCRYCYYKVDNTTPLRDPVEIVETALASGYKNVCLMGAEPTTRFDLPDMIAELAGEGITVGITTNGKKLEDLEYCRELKRSGLSYVNYSMHFTENVFLGTRRIQIVKNLLDTGIGVCQFAFTVASLEEMRQVIEVTDILINLGVRPSQFVIRAGAAIGNCQKDSGLFMSSMIKVALEFGFQKMKDGGSNLYFAEFLHRDINYHIVRWPTNETATPYSRTGPVFETPLGMMLSPSFQTVSALSPERLEQERQLLLTADVWLEKIRVERDWGNVRLSERKGMAGKGWVHCDIIQWGLKQRRECADIWPRFLADAKQAGYNEIHSCVPEQDEKLLKWQRIFGMKEQYREGGLVFFSQEVR